MVAAVGVVVAVVDILVLTFSVGGVANRAEISTSIKYNVG